MLKKYKVYIVILIILLVLSVAALISTVVLLNPNENTAMALGSFYVSAFVFAVCAITLFSFWIRRKFGVQELVALHFRQSLRQGLMAGLLTVVGLILQSLRLFSLTNLLLIIGALIFLEFYFITRDRKTI